jgi:chromosome partitioning protein
MTGEPVVTYRKDASASKSYVELAKEVENRLRVKR